MSMWQPPTNPEDIAKELADMLKWIVEKDIVPGEINSLMHAIGRNYKNGIIPLDKFLKTIVDAINQSWLSDRNLIRYALLSDLVLANITKFLIGKRISYPDHREIVHYWRFVKDATR